MDRAYSAACAGMLLALMACGGCDTSSSGLTPLPPGTAPPQLMRWPTSGHDSLDTADSHAAHTEGNGSRAAHPLLPIAGQSSDTYNAFNPHQPQASADAASPERSPQAVLPWAAGDANRRQQPPSSALAEHRVRRGMQLAERGALYSARAEFMAALDEIAKAHDRLLKDRFHAKALAAGRVALDEAEDFLRYGSQLSSGEVSRLVDRHRTPVLKSDDLDQILPEAAAERYLSYAKEKLAAASAAERSGSLALFGLARVAVKNAQTQSSPTGSRLEPALAYYQAALLVDPANPFAANELAIILAEQGDFERARLVLMHSVSRNSQAATWHNLATIHGRLGDRTAAELARRQASLHPAPAPLTPAPDVQWLDPGAFGRTGQHSEAPVAPPVSPPPATEKQNTNSAKKGVPAWGPAPRR